MVRHLFGGDEGRGSARADRGSPAAVAEGPLSPAFGASRNYSADGAAAVHHGRAYAAQGASRGGRRFLMSPLPARNAGVIDLGTPELAGCRFFYGGFVGLTPRWGAGTGGYGLHVQRPVGAGLGPQPWSAYVP